MTESRNGAAPPVPRHRAKPPRTLAWVMRPTEETPYGLLRITEEETDHYFVVPIPCELGGLAFEFTKLAPKGEKAAVYHVRLDPAEPRRSTCDCPWGTYGAAKKPCRHVAASLTLLALGQLPRAASPTTGA
jgi:hypothetical protein